MDSLSIRPRRPTGQQLSCFLAGQVINPRKVSTPQYRGGGGQVTVVADKKDVADINQVQPGSVSIDHFIQFKQNFFFLLTGRLPKNT